MIDCRQVGGEPYALGTVPQGVRFLTFAADVQKGRFVVQVEGWGIERENWLVDRFDLDLSRRRDEDGNRRPIDPARELDDWLFLLEEMVGKRYPLADGSGRVMAITRGLIDSQGEPGVTERAYDFWRHPKRRPRGQFLMLSRGEVSVGAKRIVLDYPDSQRKDRKARARGEVPVYFINSDALKDAVDADLRRAAPGPGYQHFPQVAQGPGVRSIAETFFAELVAEQRGPKGWRKVAARNEAFDLKAYNRAAFILLKAERINWSSPPAWAAEWDKNSHVSAAGLALEGTAAPELAMIEREIAELEDFIANHGKEAPDGNR